jgi:hypothetical protein
MLNLCNLEIDLRNSNVNQVKAVLSGDHYEVVINGINVQANLKFDFETFDNLADDFRSLCNEKTYQELEEAYILMEAEKEELENELECLREANEILRGR